jgi:hypothetical protein
MGESPWLQNEPANGRASPPDDGGHVGSYTQPADVMEVSDEDGPVPPLASDVVTGDETPKGSWLSPIAAVIALLLLGFGLNATCMG